MQQFLVPLMKGFMHAIEELTKKESTLADACWYFACSNLLFSLLLSPDI